MNYLNILLWIIAPAVALVLLGGALAFAMSFVEAFNRTMRERKEKSYPREIDVEANHDQIPEWLRQNGIDPNRIPEDAEISIIQAIQLEEYKTTEVGGNLRARMDLNEKSGLIEPIRRMELYPLKKHLTRNSRKG